MEFPHLFACLPQGTVGLYHFIPYVNMSYGDFNTSPFYGFQELKSHTNHHKS